MKNKITLIILFMMSLGGCTTQNPEKAKRKIARLVKNNPTVATFETDVISVEVPLDSLGLQFEADLKDNDLNEVLLEELLGTDPAEAQEVIREVDQIKQRGYKHSVKKIGKSTVQFTDKGDGIIDIKVNRPAGTKTLQIPQKKYKVDPPAEVKKKSGWTIGKSLNTAGAILLIGGSLIVVRWLFLLLRRKTKKE